jgi:hypothetical protein
MRDSVLLRLLLPYWSIKIYIFPLILRISHRLDPIDLVIDGVGVRKGVGVAGKLKDEEAVSMDSIISVGILLWYLLINPPSQVMTAMQKPS